MTIFDQKDFDAHEKVVFCHDRSSGLRAIIAIHNLNRGPALGGCRFWNYENESDAIQDALRLSRGMTYKSALANLKLGGGKAVIIGDPATEKTPEKLLAFARFVDELQGQYITANDMGTSSEDMGIIRQRTPHVVGLGYAGTGGVSAITAYGVFQGIRACAQAKFGSADLQDKHVVVQGLGSVGMNLCTLLHQEGARLTVTDINTEAVQQAQTRFSAQVASVEDALGISCDIFSPCARGGGIHDETIDQLRCTIIAGAANNQLAEPRHGQMLDDRGILYAPDYLINAGGLINVSYEGSQYNRQVVQAHVAGIYDTMLEIIEKSHTDNIPTSVACDRIAEERFRAPQESPFCPETQNAAQR